MFENIVDYATSNLETSLGVIKLMFIYLCSYITNFKILNKKFEISFNSIFNVILIIVISFISAIVRYEVSYWISIITFAISMTLIFSKHNIRQGILTTVTSMSINYIISLITVIINLILNVTIKLNENIVNLFIILISHLVLLNCVFKTRKYKYGICSLQNNSQSEPLDIFILNIAGLILFSSIIIVNRDVLLAKSLIVGLIIFFAIMIAIIKKSIQLYYKQKLFEKDLNETKAKLEEKEKEVKELEAENLKISKNSHTISHKQRALEYKIEKMLSNTEISREEAAEVRDRIKEIEKDLYKEKSAINLDKTGISLIDDMLGYMQSECKKNKIDFELQIKGNIHYMTNNLISKEDLETLLADHIKNAIIAINHTHNVNRSILVRLGEIDGIYSLYIYDSGIEFEKETLENLGKKPSTTHANEGGTGMGFMNTFDTLRKCQASLIINELNEPTKENYTKAIIIKFDKKNKFEIISYH